MIKGFEPRLYQQTILDTCTRSNTLVVLPTGLGKTGVALMLAAHRLEKFPDSKVIFLAPTKPLVQQHLNTFDEFLDTDNIDVFTGDISPDNREARWKDLSIIFSTPQGFENDVISGRIRLEDVSLAVFDEAHRASGDYAYVFLAKQYMKQAKNPLILGLTASPGADAEKIKEICSNLFIDEIELRTEEDPDVQPYIKQVDVKRIMVKMPEGMKQASGYLRKCFDSKLIEIKNMGYLQGNPKNYNRLSLIKLQGALQARMSKGERDYEIMKSISRLAEAMKVQHAIILLETQGVEAAVIYMERLQEQARNTKTKAVQNLVKDLNFRSALAKARNLRDDGIEHPKLQAVKKIVSRTLSKRKNAKIMIFNQYRDQVVKIKEALDEIGVASEVFVGQAKKSGTGMSQKEQKEAINRFEKGDFNCLLATSVAEEGLDIPAVGLVLFYEPVPSGIRTVQRRGRTGRQEKGLVVVLITKDTVDEAYRWSAHHKESRMVKAIKKMKKNFEPEYDDRKLEDYTEEKLVVYADYREKGSGVIKELASLGIEVKMKTMEVGDYLLSEDLCVEFKTVPDFVDSIVDGRLLDQLKSLRQYRKPLIIIEGGENMYSQRKIHPNALRGMLATMMMNYRIPVFQTKDAKETAGFLILLAKREQQGREVDFQFHSSKPLTLKERQEYLVAALPGIGNKLAKPLLREFGSIKNIVNASVDELRKVELIGKKKAEKIRELLDSGYEE